MLQQKTMVLAGEQRLSVCCGKALPWASKLTRPVVTEAEANTKQWAGERNTDGTMSVDMCLQCQIDRCDEQKRSHSLSALPTGYQLNGLIERVTFFSEESGFCVLRVKAEGHRDLVTVVGSVPSVLPGEWITAEGDWVIDKEHGQQLKAFHLKTMPPNTREGMEKYLGSGTVKGIRPIYAKRLITRSEELFEVIEKTPNSLEQIEGIRPKRKLKIVSAWSGFLLAKVQRTTINTFAFERVSKRSLPATRITDKLQVHGSL